MLKDDLLLITKFKNNRLHEAVSRHGGVKAVAAAAGVSQGALYGLITLRTFPYSKTGLRPSAQKIAEFFNTEPVELFPMSLYALNLPVVVERTLDSAETMTFLEARKAGLLPEATSMGTERLLDHEDMLANMEAVLQTLTSRAREIIKLRFGLGGEREHTLEEIAAVFDISRERVRRIEGDALRHMRHPAHSRFLRPYLFDAPLENS